MNSIGKTISYLAASAAVTGLGTYLYASRVEARRYLLEKVTVKVRNSRAEHKRCIRVLHLSDLHLCYPETGKIEFLRRITAEPYDMVVLTGDVFENYSGLAYAGAMLSRLPRLGAYAVLGNHDYYNYTMMHKSLGRLLRAFRHPPQKRDVQPMVQALEKNGFTVLRNQTVNLDEHGIHLVGVDYPYTPAVNLHRLAAEGRNHDLRLLLFHLPIYVSSIAASGVHVAFGGHTHGGQIRLPGLGAIITDSELSRAEASGLFWRDETAFHISRGLGADPRTNFRLFCPPAATVVEVLY